MRTDDGVRLIQYELGNVIEFSAGYVLTAEQSLSVAR
jgi:hypothetical protein